MKKPRTIAEACTMYEGLPDDQRMALICEFDKVHGDKPNKEQKFYSWLKNKRFK